MKASTKHINVLRDKMLQPWNEVLIKKKKKKEHLDNQQEIFHKGDQKVKKTGGGRDRKNKKNRDKSRRSNI